MSSRAAEFDLVVRGGLLVDGSVRPVRVVTSPWSVTAWSPWVRSRVGDGGARRRWHGRRAGLRRRAHAHGRAGLLGRPGKADVLARRDERRHGQYLWVPRPRACPRGHAALVVRNLERAEDIAPEAMAQGITWTWSTFAEFLDAVDARPEGLNHAAAIGHSALRTWAMGERAFEENANEDDLAAMALELRSALARGRRRVHDIAQRRSRHVRRSPGRVTAGIVGRGRGVGRDPRPRERRCVPAGARALARPRCPPRLRSALARLAISSGAPIVFGIFSAKLPQPSLELMDETAVRGGDLRG